MKRLLITGSRDIFRLEERQLVLSWMDRTIDEGGYDVVVHGAARGVDSLADRIATTWDRWPITVERHPADWDRHGKAAGPRRNLEMVRMGAAGCLAFPRGVTGGTWHCLTEAVRAGIPTMVVALTASSAHDNDPAEPLPL